jgi:hypothetical protein
MEDLQIQSFTVINDALTKFVRENALMRFIRKKAHEARTLFFFWLQIEIEYKDEKRFLKYYIKDKFSITINFNEIWV